MNYRRASACVLSADQVTSMDVSAFGEGGDGSRRSCYQCGQRGHLVKDCHHRKSAGAQQQHSSAGGEGGKGKGQRAGSKGQGARARKVAKINSSVTKVAVRATPVIGASVGASILLMKVKITVKAMMKEETIVLKNLKQKKLTCENGSSMRSLVS